MSKALTKVLIVMISLTVLVAIVITQVGSEELVVMTDKGISLVALRNNVCPIAKEFCCGASKNSMRQDGIFSSVLKCVAELWTRLFGEQNYRWPKACCVFPIFNVICAPTE